MQWLLVALCVLVAGGLVALATARSGWLSTLFGATATVAGTAIAAAGMFEVLVRGAAASIELDWHVPYGSFSIGLDPLSAFFLLPVLVLSALGAIYGSRYLAAFWHARSVGGLWLFYNLLVAGMVLVVLARNGMLFLVAWEVMSLAAFFLITFEDDQEEVRDAGRTFLVATHLGTAFLLVMFSLLGAQSESLDFLQFSPQAFGASASVLFLLALIGFGTKAGLMPLHVWLPESYPVAPSFVSAVMSGAMSKLGVYGLLRVLLLMGGVEEWWGWLLVVAGAVSGVLGILSALGQSDLKRLLAYSSIENMGIIFMGLGLGILGMTAGSPALATLGFAGALLHVLNHALFKGLLFLGAGSVWHATGTRRFDQLGGLLKRMPYTGSALLIGAAAIAGLPPLNGFASEFLLYSASLTNEGLLGPSPDSLAALAVIASLTFMGGLAVFAFAKAFGIAFLGEPRTPQTAAATPRSGRMFVPLVILAAGCIGVGLFSPQVVDTLLPVVAQVSRQPLEAVAGNAKVSLEPLQCVAAMSMALVVMVGLLAVARRALLWRRDVAVSGTWGCGYARPTPRIQYTSSSFAQPAVEFFAPLYRWRETLLKPSGLFPQSASLETSSGDLSKELLYRPLFGSIGWALSKLRWLQHGRVHVYVLYVGLTILALMVWYAGVASLPSGPAPEVTVQAD